MPVIHRLKHNFTAGEISPLTSALVDFSRFKNGCLVMKNMMSIAQGPATRRTGFEFIYNLSLLGFDHNDPQVRFVPFIHSEEFTYELIFFMHTDGIPRMIIAADDGLIIYPDPVEPFCPPDAILAITYTGPNDYDMDIPLESGEGISVFHVSTDDPPVRTELIPTEDYTVTINDPRPHTLTVTEGTTSIPNNGELDILRRNLNSPGDIVALEIEGLDIKNFDYAQSGDELHIAQSTLQPGIIKRYGHYCWESVELTLTDQPEEWDDTNGWPELVTFFQQRLVYACTTLQTHSLWLSRAGDFHNFTEDTNDDTAFSMAINSETQNKIQWLQARRALNLSTLASEWTITGATSYALTYQNILSERHTNNGSERIKPLAVNFATLFVERHGRNINEFVYDYTFDSYRVNDLSILAPHLTDEASVISWAYQQTPYSIVWAALEDGTLIALTYQRDQKIVGWHRHDTQGEIIEIGVRPSKVHREDEVLVCVKRTNGYFLERKTVEFRKTRAIDGHFLDSYDTYEGDPVNKVTGLDHLEGETVDILVDGAVHPSVLVYDGTVKLNNYYSKVVAGLNYESEIRPTVHDIALQDGTAIGRVHRIIDIELNFHESLGCIIGRADQEDGDYEEVVPFRIPGDLMGQAVPLFNGIKHLAFPEGYDRKAEYFIKQTQPLPMTILSVVDVVEVGD